MSGRDLPIDAAEFDALMRGLGLTPASGPVAVAVSGGPDSLALALLAARWGETVALTVDHGLRPDSGEEARRVGSWMTEHGIAHHVLAWRAEKPQTGLQAAARKARYRLLEDWCRANGVGALLLGHHQDDQAETLLLRLARGSGLWGLAGMASAAAPLTEPDLGAPRRYRPFLDLPKSRLAATCRAFGQDWIEDPANRDPAYDRSRARALLNEPPLPGLDGAGLAETAKRLRRARNALAVQANAVMADCARIDPAGYALLDRHRLHAAPEETGMRVLTQLLEAVGGLSGPPRGARIERAYAALGAERFAGLTTAGCQLVAQNETTAAICREPAAAAAPLELSPETSAIWDGRFRVENRTQRRLSLGALGEAGWRELRESWPSASNGGALPEPARLVLPAFRDGETILAVPHLAAPPQEG